jgi:hypothetical protein
VNAESRRASVARAALALGALVMAIAIAPAPAERIGCGAPFERAADVSSGFTTEVGCGASSTRAQIRGPARLLFGMPLDVNRATQEALEALPAIGPARAAAIVRARADRRFESLADLERVPGIGRKTSEGLHAWATVTTTTDMESRWTVR